jgi:hypothetical protein
MYSLFTTDSVTKPFPFLNVPSITNPCYCFVNNSAPCFDRMKHGMSATEKSNQSFCLILVIAFLYCMWCASQIYLRQPSQPAIGEEADLGVIIFLSIYLFLPHGLCVLSMNQKDSIPVFCNVL